MIPIDFQYYRPATVDEAISLSGELRADHKQPIYYSGGTEVINRTRLIKLAVDAVIDLKGIKECLELSRNAEQIVIGAAVTLTNVAESQLFPLLANVSRQIATHTERNKITVGGNLCGHLFYKEMLLPFLLTESTVVIAGENGLRKTEINDNCHNSLQLKEGEFVVQLITDAAMSQCPYIPLKKNGTSNVHYPIVSLASLLVDGQLRIAFSGVCDFAFRSEAVEKALNSSKPHEKRIQKAIDHLPAAVLDDSLASEGYRKFVLENALRETLEKAEGASQ